MEGIFHPSGRSLYWLIIAIVLADFLFAVWLKVLNIRASQNPVLKVLEGLYDDEKYARQQSYFRINQKVSFISSGLSLLITLAFFAFGGYGWLDGVARGITSKPVLQSLCFFGFIYVVTFLISLPFSIYETFVVEQKYGFNKTTRKVFAGDTVKSFLLSAVISGGLLALCVWVYTVNPKWFWLIAWAIYAAFILFFQYFYSELIVPLFNKQKPLEEGELRTAIEAFAAKAGFPSPAEEVREKLDLVKLLVQHSASTFFFRIDGISMVDADMDEGDIPKASVR